MKHKIAARVGKASEGVTGIDSNVQYRNECLVLREREIERDIKRTWLKHQETHERKHGQAMQNSKKR